jgi:two-component system, chemotaxis family, sensor kinase CheA
MDKDPYRYYRIEARELVEGLTRGALELEKGPSGPEAFARLLRLAHTLKGASRVVKQPAIAELAHQIEGVLAPHRATPGPLSREGAGDVLRLLDVIAEKLARIDSVAEAPRDGAVRAPTDEPLDTVRVEVRELDSLLQGVLEAGAQLAALRQRLTTLEHTRRLAGVLLDQLAPRAAASNGVGSATARARSMAEELRASVERAEGELAAGLDRASGEVAQTSSRAGRMRLLPVSSIFAALERAARDAAQSLQKRITFETAGEDARLDAHVLASLRDALQHVVRNAVAHGVETEAERVAAGKPPAGSVQVHVRRQGHRVAFVCRDDGRGIDVEAVRRAAVRLGLIAPAEAASLGVDDALKLILRGGVTTTGVVTEVSGRGIGLDVLRETAQRLKGEVRVRSQRGRGTTVEVLVPVSVSSLAALVVHAGGVGACVPLHAVRASLRLGAGEVPRTAQGESVVYDGKAIPFLPLAGVLRRPAAPTRADAARSVVVIESGSARVALGVDALLGITRVVARPLPGMVAADATVAEASLDAEGHVQLVLDPAGLVEAAAASEGAAERAVPAPSHPPVLVVDDSLTTRMLEQSILESAGYDVDLANSAEEALRKTRDRRYGLFLVDVEMPGMDGFELVERTRADPALREIPSILVTSRGSADDRRRGELAGASAYVVKSEFDQAHLLRTIRGLIG